MGYTAMVLSETLHLVASFLPFASSSALTMMMLVSSVNVSHLIWDCYHHAL